MLRSLVTRSLGLAFALVLILATAATAARPQPALLVLEGEIATENGGDVAEGDWINAGDVAVADTDVLLLDLWTGRVIELPAEAAIAAGGPSFAGNPPTPYVAGCMCKCGGEWVFIPSGSPGSSTPTAQQCQSLQGHYCFPPGGGGGTTPPTLSHCHAGFGPGIPMLGGMGGLGGT